MSEFKIVISDPKTGKSYQREAKDDSAAGFTGLKIGHTVKGELIDLTGYEFEITGGSDKSGFPMRKDLPGSGRKKILAVSGVGLKKKDKGIKQRKTVCGNTIGTNTAQINLKIVKQGKTPLEPQPEEKTEPEKQAEEKPSKEEPAKKEEKIEEKPIKKEEKAAKKKTDETRKDKKDQNA